MFGQSSELAVRSAKCLFVWFLLAHLTLGCLDNNTDVHSSMCQCPSGLRNQLGDYREVQRHVSTLDTFGHQSHHQTQASVPTRTVSSWVALQEAACTSARWCYCSACTPFWLSCPSPASASPGFAPAPPVRLHLEGNGEKLGENLVRARNVCSLEHGLCSPHAGRRGERERGLRDQQEAASRTGSSSMLPAWVKCGTGVGAGRL